MAMYRTYGSIFGQILVAISSDDFFNVIEINIFLSLSLFLPPPSNILSIFRDDFLCLIKNYIMRGTSEEWLRNQKNRN